jgi:hypothetical protein
MTMSAPRSFDPAHVCASGGRRDRRADVLGQLDGVCADAAGAGVDQQLVTGLHVRALDERLPGGQRDERDRRGLGHRDRRRVAREWTASRCAKVPTRPSRGRP